MMGYLVCLQPCGTCPARSCVAVCRAHMMWVTHFSDCYQGHQKIIPDVHMIECVVNTNAATAGHVCCARPAAAPFMGTNMGPNPAVPSCQRLTANNLPAGSFILTKQHCACSHINRVLYTLSNPPQREYLEPRASYSQIGCRQCRSHRRPCRSKVPRRHCLCPSEAPSDSSLGAASAASLHNPAISVTEPKLG
jgi:hypothetical protein